MGDHKEKVKGIDADFIKKGTKKLTEEDIEKVTQKADEIKGKFESAGPLKRFIDDVKLLISMVKDYWNHKYTEIPFWVIATVVFALLYVLSPVDLIPDVIPGAGYLDDAAVVALCLLMIEKELDKYREWKETEVAG